MSRIEIHWMEMSIVMVIIMWTSVYSVELPPAALAYEFNFSYLIDSRSRGSAECKSANERR